MKRKSQSEQAIKNEVDAIGKGIFIYNILDGFYQQQKKVLQWLECGLISRRLPPDDEG